MKDLITYVHNLDEDEEAYIQCEKIEYGDGTIRLSIVVRITYGFGPRQEWSVVCKGVRESQGAFNGDQVEVLNDHPLLWEYNLDHASLSFRGAPKNVDAAIGALWRVHCEAVQSWIPFTKFLNNFPLAELLSGGFGQFASGPVALIERYAAVLRSHGVDVLVSKPWWPQRYVAEKLVPEARSARILLLGDGYVIGDSFEAVKR